MASLQERVNNRKYYKRVRRDGKWVTIDTRTNKIVDKATRIKHKSENKEKWIQRGKNRERAVGKWLKDNVTDRLFDSDEDDPNHPVKGGKLTQRQARLKYEKEVANRDTGKDDSEMTAKQQKNALKISKKRDLTNIKVEKPKSEQLKVNKDEGNNAYVRGQQKKDASSSSSSPNNETKEQWLKRTRNSPAAKAFGNSAAANEKRWQARQNHLKWKASRKKKKK